MLALPVLDEVDNLATVAALAASCRTEGLVDRAVLIDGGSTDGTRERARELELEVVEAERLEPAGPVRGKGDGVWRFVRSLDPAAVERVVLIDGDVVGLGPRSVAALLAALTERPGVVLVKGVCRRIVDGGPDGTVWRAGRVSELVARPLLAALAPGLERLADPLSGQVALDLAAIAGLPLASGYGLELAMLLAVHDRHGVDAIAEVALEPIRHRQKDVDELAPVARDVVAVALAHLGVPHPDPEAPIALPPSAVVPTAERRA